MANEHGVFGLERDTNGVSRALVQSMIDSAIAALVTVPVGAILAHGSGAAPDGFLVCNGAAVSRTDYADLFAAIGTTFGVGDGTTTFNLPDLAGRVPMGAGSGSGLSPRGVGDKVGAETVVLSTANLASHVHTGSVVVNSASHAHAVSGTAASTGHNHGVSGTTSGGGLHNHTTYAAQAAAAAAGTNAFGLGLTAIASSSHNTTSSSNGSHDHTYSATTDFVSHSHVLSASADSASHAHTGTVTVDAAGNGTGHANVQPSTVVAFIIRATP